MPLLKHIGADSNRVFDLVAAERSGEAAEAAAIAITENAYYAPPYYPIFIALYFILIAVNGILRKNFQPIYFFDIILFLTFYIYYIKRLAQDDEEIDEFL
jgi:hypothetical protein